MKIKIFMCAILVLAMCNVYAQEVSTGLIFDDENYESEFRIARGLDFTDLDTINFISLRSYAPVPGNQGKFSSCVSWASGYAALTICNRVAGRNTDPRSPWYIFNQIAQKKCDVGSTIKDVLKLLQEKGDCAVTEFSPSLCDSMPGTNTSVSASSHKIKDYYTLWGMNDVMSMKIKNTIVSLASKKPVIIGMQTYANLEKVGADGIYKPDTLSGSNGGHAMCVVGFDKTKKQFEILNSWGPAWGQGGYCYVSFDDYARYTKYAYCINAETRTSLNFADKEVELSGEFVFKKLVNANNDDIRFEEVKPVLKNGIYHVSDKSTVNDFYKLIVQNAKENTFLYIFSFKPDLSSELLFPKSDNNMEIKDVPIITSKKVKVFIPENPDNAFTTDKTGSDFLCILYSYKRIDNIRNLVSTIEAVEGSFNERLQTVFGKMLIPNADIQYANDLMKIDVKSTNGYVAPIILNVHVTN